jgi:fructuronate reductase
MVVSEARHEMPSPDANPAHAPLAVDRGPAAAMTGLARPTRCSLGAVQATTVDLPRYDLGRLGRGIVHLGLGAFHRAHQALCTEVAMAAADTRWGSVGVSLCEPRVAELLAARNHLDSAAVRRGEQVRTRVVGALLGAPYAPQALPEVLAAIADPATAIVSATVTEKGYCGSAATTDLDLDDCGIGHDIARPDAPQTALSVLAAGIRRRAPRALSSIVCCGNMAANGDAPRKLLVHFASQIDAGLARRIEADIGLSDSKADRIVPAAGPASLEFAQARLGLRDEAAIVCEPFTQWVIEDRFSAARPAWEDAGALVTADVRPYEAMKKLRLLNGTHPAIAYAGQLCGPETVAAAMAHPLIGRFARRLMEDELRATVAPPPGCDTLAYCSELLLRLENPSLAHRTERIAMDGTHKLPLRWLPALRESLDAGIEHPQPERALAIWLHCPAAARYEHGAPLVINDPGAATLVAALGRRRRGCRASRTRDSQRVRRCTVAAGLCHATGRPPVGAALRWLGRPGETLSRPAGAGQTQRGSLPFRTSHCLWRPRRPSLQWTP